MRVRLQGSLRAAPVQPRPCRSSSRCASSAAKTIINRLNQSAAKAIAAPEASLPACLFELATGFERLWLAEGGPSELRLLPADPRFARVDGGPPGSRLSIENRFYASRAFRFCHLETCTGAVGQLSVLHCVMYPHPALDLPIFSVDMVAFGSRVTLAIADVCPSRLDLSLPPGYARVAELAPLLVGLQLRGTPEWGEQIFSRDCVCTSPGDSEAATSAFAAYALALLRLHLEAAEAALTSPPRPAEAVAETEAAHARYCEQQLRNDKTRRVLAHALGDAFADDYLRMMFPF